MRTSVLVALVATLLAACAAISLRGPADEAAEKPLKDFERTADPTLRAKHLAERFPGIGRIDLVKTLVWAGPRRGACWSEVPSADRTGIDATYRLEGLWTKTEAARSSAELLARGWTKIYRSPRGEGFERRARFRSIDLALDSELACRCAPKGQVSEERIPMTLRFRWEKGKMPEVSASLAKDGKRKGLVPAITAGRLVTYQFPARAEFPGGAPGCGANLALTLLLEPPIL
jgi:hypothetical protein